MKILIVALAIWGVVSQIIIIALRGKRTRSEREIKELDARIIKHKAAVVELENTLLGNGQNETRR